MLRTAANAHQVCRRRLACSINLADNVCQPALCQQLQLLFKQPTSDVVRALFMFLGTVLLCINVFNGAVRSIPASVQSEYPRPLS